MKKLFSLVLTMLLLFSLTACREPVAQHTEPPASTQEEIPATAAPTQPTTAETEAAVITPSAKIMSAVFVPTVSQALLADDNTVLVNCSSQSISLTLQEPEVADKVIIDFLNRIDSLNNTAQQLYRQALEFYSPQSSWTAYMCRVQYAPMRVDTGVLSLFGGQSIYSGGGHPEHLPSSINYDLLTGDVLTLGSVMHKDATTQMFCDLVLNDLTERQEELYLFENFQNAVINRFDRPESEDYDFFFTATGLCFYFSPYEIAPYSSGTILSEIPYTDLTGLLHDAYFPSEHIATNGEIFAKVFDNSQNNDVNQISEAVLTSSGKMVLLTASNAVENVQLTLLGDGQVEEDNIFYAASSLAPGSGIMIQATDEELARILVTYTNADGVQMKLISANLLIP